MVLVVLYKAGHVLSVEVVCVVCQLCVPSMIV